MTSQKSVVFITGANTGIGFEVAKALYSSEKAYEVIIGSRSVDNGTNAVALIEKEIPKSASSLSCVQVDISSDESIAKARDEISTRFGRLDALVNNAGASFDRKIQIGELSLREAWNTSWDTNVSGTMVITTEFVPLLLKSSDPRLLFVTSGTSSLVNTQNFEHPALKRINASPSAGWPKDQQLNPITSYRSTKTGLNMAMCEWHRILKNDGVKVWAISPGFLATGLGGVGPDILKKMGAGEPATGGQFMKDVIEGTRDGDVGKVIHPMMVQPWFRAVDVSFNEGVRDIWSSSQLVSSSANEQDLMVLQSISSSRTV